MWEASRETKKAALVFLIIGFSIPIISFLFEYIPNPSIYQERKANMLLEFNNINPPVHAEEIKKTISEKFTQVWINAKYKVNMNKETIYKHYLNELDNKGWKYEGESNDGRKIFKKNDLKFALEVKQNEFRVGLYYDGSGPNF